MIYSTSFCQQGTENKKQLILNRPAYFSSPDTDQNIQQQSNI